MIMLSGSAGSVAHSFRLLAPWAQAARAMSPVRNIVGQCYVEGKGVESETTVVPWNNSMGHPTFLNSCN